jgi:hypothetical protein
MPQFQENYADIAVHCLHHELENLRQEPVENILYVA